MRREERQLCDWQRENREGSGCLAVNESCAEGQLIKQSPVLAIKLIVLITQSEQIEQEMEL